MSGKEMDYDAHPLLSGLWAEREQRTAALGFDLLPCPFCGGTPYVEYNDEFDMEFVQCACGASYADGDDLSGWNSRVESPAQGKH